MQAGVQDEVLQKLLTATTAAESSLSHCSTPQNSAALPQATVERRKQALLRGDAGVLLEHSSLSAEFRQGETHCLRNPAVVATSVPEKVLPQHIASDFVPPGVGSESGRAVAALAYLCDEAGELAGAGATLVQGALMFGCRPRSGVPEEDEASDQRAEELALCMGEALPFFQEIRNFAMRTARVARNLVCQIAGCMTDEVFRSVHIVPVGEALCVCLGLLIALDEAVKSNTELGDAWRTFKVIVRDKSTKAHSEGEVDPDFAAFEQLVVGLDQSVLSSNSFLLCIEQNFNPTGSDTGVRGNAALHNEVKGLLNLLYDRYTNMVGSASETNERNLLVGVYGLYALYRRLLPASQMPDAKLFKKLYTVFPSKCPVINVCGDVAFYPTTFMHTFAPFEVKGIDPSGVTKAANDYCKKLDESFPRQADAFKAACCAWIASAESELSASARAYTANGDRTGMVAIEARGSLILKGVVIAYRASALVKTLLCLHKSLGTPLTSKLIKPVRSLVEVLKAIEVELMTRRRAAVATSQPAVLRLLALNILRRFKSLRNVTQSGTSRKVKKLAACLAALDGTLKGSSTYGPARRYAAYVSACACSDPTVNGGITPQDSQAAEALIRRLFLLADLDANVKRACSCDFLYFNRELVPIFLQDVYKEKRLDVAGLQLLINGICDCEPMLKCAPQLNSEVEGEADEYVEQYRRFVLEEVLQVEIVDKLCTEVENDLRLHVHTKNLDFMKSINPKTDKRMKIRPLLLMPPLVVFDVVVDVQKEVKSYLEMTFYNLTTVALHDWLTYSEMANLAKDKYGIVLSENHLPMGSLDQGLDILQIMRNIHVFVARFNYNLNQQNFIERRPDRGSKNINTISIESISCSIRQHGLGIMNTTINYTYQYLAKKFHIFSQFLFDDYIRSYLAKEKRWFKKHHKDEDVDNKYPFERAMAFVKEIRKLGVTDGKSFLDQFRILISEIGNALGYVRMVRSAGMKYCSEAVQFVPEIDEVGVFEEMAGNGSGGGDEEAGEDGGGGDEGVGEGEEAKSKVPGAGLSDWTVNAGRNLDSAIAVIKTNLTDSVDYFHVLVSVFKEVLLGDSGENNKHLDSFFIIIPSLLLSFIDASLTAKDMMHKKSRASRDAYFSDDGFAMGVAYILSILGQTEHFDALHIFQSLREKYDGEAKELEKRQKAQMVKLEAKRKAKSKTRSFFSRRKKEEEEDSDDDEVTTLQLTAKRLGAHRRETEMLFFSLQGARIFFSNRQKVESAE